MRFTKMHGLGNDFVVIDCREHPFTLSAAQVRAIADRRTGVGCDQLIVLEPAAHGNADLFMRIHNADGGEVGACGNGSRCVGALVAEETGISEVVIETAAGLLNATIGPGGLVTVDMGEARLEWGDIPLARETDTLRLDLECGPLSEPVAVGMGNPHAVFFVDDIDDIALAEIGPAVEHHELFPEDTNVEIVRILAPDRLRVRVWERGVGITRACGTGACASLVAAVRREMAERKAEIVLDGGVLEIEWRDDGHVLMTGPVAVAFSGTLDASLVAAR